MTHITWSNIVTDCKHRVDRRRSWSSFPSHIFKLIPLKNVLYCSLPHTDIAENCHHFYDKTNSNRDFRCLPLSSPTGLGVLEPLPKRSKAFNMSSDEILFSFPEHLSISFKSLGAKNCCFGLERSSVSC